jgi:hypothetical protein
MVASPQSCMRRVGGLRIPTPVPCQRFESMSCYGQAHRAFAGFFLRLEVARLQSPFSRLPSSWRSPNRPCLNHANRLHAQS